MGFPHKDVHDLPTKQTQRKIPPFSSTIFPATKPPGHWSPCEVWLEHATSLGLEVPKTVEKALEELRHLVMVFFGSCGANVINSEGLIVINSHYSP